MSTSIIPTRTGVLDPASAEVLPWRLIHRDATVLLRPLEDRDELFDLWVKTPEIASRPAPQAQRLTQELLAWTGWSRRGLASMLEISHPTVSALEQGVSLARAGDLFDPARRGARSRQEGARRCGSRHLKDQPPVGHAVRVRRQRKRPA